MSVCPDEGRLFQMSFQLRVKPQVHGSKNTCCIYINAAKPTDSEVLAQDDQRNKSNKEGLQDLQERSSLINS